MRFNPSANKYTDYLTELLGKIALTQISGGMETEQKKELYTWEQQQKQSQTLKMLEQAKSMGLFGNIGTDTGSAYMKGIDLETGIPKIEFRTPGETEEQEFQSRIRSWLEAKRLGKSMVGKRVSLLPPEQKSQFIKARGTYGAGLPEFGGRQFLQSESGKYKERIAGEQPVIDPETGQILYNRPKGAVFQPKVKEAVSYDPALTQKVIGNIKTQEDLNELLKNKSAYKEAGVEIATVIKSVFNTPIGQKNKGILQKIFDWIAGG